MSTQSSEISLTNLMSSVHPLGLFAVIPYELRNEIYRYLFPSRLVVYGRNKATVNYQAVDTLHQAILQTSRLISEEAMNVFYSETIFHYAFECECYEHGPLPSIKLRQRMANVVVTIPCGYWGHVQHLGFFFRGLGSAGDESPVKNTLHISLTDAPRDMPRIGYTGFFDHLEALRSFRNVVIEVNWLTYYSDYLLNVVHDISEADEKHLENYLGVVLAQIEGKVAKVLKVHDKPKMGPRKGLAYARCMVMHPRERRVKQEFWADTLLEAGEVE